MNAQVRSDKGLGFYYQQTSFSERAVNIVVCSSLLSQGTGFSIVNRASLSVGVLINRASLSVAAVNTQVSSPKGLWFHDQQSIIVRGSLCLRSKGGPPKWTKLVVGSPRTPRGIANWARRELPFKACRNETKNPCGHGTGRRMPPLLLT